MALGRVRRVLAVTIVWADRIIAGRTAPPRLANAPIWGSALSSAGALVDVGAVRAVACFAKVARVTLAGEGSRADAVARAVEGTNWHATRGARPALGASTAAAFEADALRRITVVGTDAMTAINASPPGVATARAVKANATPTALARLTGTTFKLAGGARPAGEKPFPSGHQRRASKR